MTLHTSLRLRLLTDDIAHLPSPQAASNSANAYYPPANAYGAGTKPAYAFAQLFSYNQNNFPSAAHAGCPAPSGDWYWPINFDDSAVIPAPGFISGATLWLKQSTVSVGFFHLPNPNFNSSYQLPTPPITPPPPTLTCTSPMVLMTDVCALPINSLLYSAAGTSYLATQGSDWNLVLYAPGSATGCNRLPHPSSVSDGSTPILVMQQVNKSDVINEAREGSDEELGWAHIVVSLSKFSVDLLGCPAPHHEIVSSVCMVNIVNVTGMYSE